MRCVDRDLGNGIVSFGEAHVGCLSFHLVGDLCLKTAEGKMGRYALDPDVDGCVVAMLYKARENDFVFELDCGENA